MKRRFATRILPSRRRAEKGRVRVLAGVALVMLGCGSKGAVSLSARGDAAALEISPNAFGAELTGGFDLVLEVGDAAPRRTTVTLGGFVLKQDQDIVVDALSFTPSEPFPLDVGVGDSKTVRLVLDPALQVTLDVANVVCAGDVWFAGTVVDTLSDGRPTPVSSARFTPSCP